MEPQSNSRQTHMHITMHEDGRSLARPRAHIISYVIIILYYSEPQRPGPQLEAFFRGWRERNTTPSIVCESPSLTHTLPLPHTYSLMSLLPIIFFAVNGCVCLWRLTHRRHAKTRYAGLGSQRAAWLSSSLSISLSHFSRCVSHLSSLFLFGPR